jgi:hypothetical protein
MTTNSVAKSAPRTPATRAAKSAPRAPAARARRANTTPPAARARPPTTPRNRPVLHAVAAAEQAVRRNSVHIDLPLIGRLQLPPPDEVAFLGGVAVLVLIGIVEWPVGVALGIGHALATNRHNRAMRAFGEALEEA